MLSVQTSGAGDNGNSPHASKGYPTPAIAPGIIGQYGYAAAGRNRRTEKSANPTTA